MLKRRLTTNKKPSCRWPVLTRPQVAGFQVAIGGGGSISANKPWLIVGEEDFYGVETVTVSVDPSGLEPGTYLGTVHVEYFFYSLDDEEDVEVKLVVVVSGDS